MHTLFLLARMGAFFLWMGCWCVWLERRLRLPAAAAPLAVVCGSSVALYAAALLNVMAPVQLALYLAGPALALVELRRGAGQALRPFVSVSTALFLAAAGLTLLLERGRVIDEHDALAHWAVAAKSILNNGRLPNMGDLAVEYVDYPPAAALWIKLVCNITGFSDGGMVFAQGLVFLAALLAFAPLCKKRWYAGAAVAGFGLFLACTTTAWRDLRVDGLLTAATAAVWAVTAALRRSPERSLPAAIPALCFLVLLKNSGLFFVLLAGLPLVVLLARRGAGPAWKRAGLAALPLAAPALCWWLWQAHVAQVFVDASASKHAASLSAYGQRLADKTPEDLAAFRQAFAACWTDFSRPAVLRAWLFLGLFAAVCLVLAAAKRLSARAAAGYAAAAVFSGAVYVAALAGIYLFSMSTEEMLALASIERYASSFFDCLPAAALVLALAVRPAPEGRSGLRPAPGDGPLAWGCLAAALLLAGLAVAQGEPSKLWRPARADAPAARQQYWLDLKQAYGLPDRASYLLYTNAAPVDTWSEGYVARYALNTNDLLFVQGEERLTAATALEYDFIVFCAPDETSRAFLECLGLDPATPFVELSPHRGQLLRMEWEEQVALEEFAREAWPSVWDKVSLANGAGTEN